MQRQTQTQRQTLKYSPLQIQMLNLLHLTTMELEQRIKEELEENPILEEGKEETASEDTVDEFQDSDDSSNSGEDDYPSVQDYQDWDEFRNDDIPDYKTYANNQSADNELYTRPMIESISFRDDLKQQVHFLRLDERQQLVADFILDSLDEDGFLRRESEVIADDISFANSMFIDTEEVELMLRVIQQLDPPGIAAKDLKECLLIQLQRIENQDECWGWAYKIVSDAFDELGSRNYDKIMRVLSIDEECLKKAIQLITTLNPKPASGLRNDSLVN